MLPHFAQVAVFIFIGWLHFPTLEKWSFVGDVLCLPAAHSPLITKAIYSRDAPYEGCVDTSVVQVMWVGWQVWLAPSPVDCQTLPCVAAAGRWLAGSGHEVADCRTLREFWGWHTGRQIQCSGHLGAVAHPLEGEARSWGQCQPTARQSQVLESGCRLQGSQSWYQIAGGWGQFLTQLGAGPGCPEACVGLAVSKGRAHLGPVQNVACQWVGQVHRLWGCSFLAAGVCPLVSEAGPKTRAGSLMGRARAQPVSGQALACQWVGCGHSLLSQ